MSDEDLAVLVAILKNATHTGAFKAGLAQAISHITDLRARQAVLVEALKFYAIESHYFEAMLPLMRDGGEKARTALAQE